MKTLLILLSFFAFGAGLGQFFDLRSYLPWHQSPQSEKRHLYALAEPFIIPLIREGRVESITALALSLTLNGPDPSADEIIQLRHEFLKLFLSQEFSLILGHDVYGLLADESIALQLRAAGHHVLGRRLHGVIITEVSSAPPP